MKNALITGIFGQDGSYLAELLLSKGYKVFGLAHSENNIERIENIKNNPDFEVIYGDICNGDETEKLIKNTAPNEIYNLAALTNVSNSFTDPVNTANTNAIGTLNVLEGIKKSSEADKIKFYQASSSKLFAQSNSILNENSPFVPESPYACAKLYAYWITVIYRNTCKIFASNGILFNHESKRRGEDFVTKKITNEAVKIKAGIKDKIYIGNLSSKRDWGHSKDFVNAMWKILQHSEPDDFVISTGIATTVREFCERVFEKLDIPIFFEGEGTEEKGYLKSNGKCVVEVLPQLYKPTDCLYGDSSKARKLLNWDCKYTIDDIIEEMIESAEI